MQTGNTERNTRRIEISDVEQTAELFGTEDGYLTKVCSSFDVNIVQRGDEIIITGNDTKKAQDVIEDMFFIMNSGEHLDQQKVEYALELVKEGRTYRDSMKNSDIVCFTAHGKPIKAKTAGQIEYVKKIAENDIVFGVGPAGTGKTYLAVAMAVKAFKKKEVNRIILARPAVEAGENLGFLPGDLQEKVDPYLRPLYDALYEILGKDTAERLKEKENIEVVPLAYMRGRTLDDSFIILDEAQNTTREQMKMFLTRLGFGSKAVVTGDITQIDLPKKKASGLKDALRILKGVEGIQFSYLRESDVVRHPLVRRIIAAYDRASERETDR